MPSNDVMLSWRFFCVAFAAVFSAAGGTLFAGSHRFLDSGNFLHVDSVQSGGQHRLRDSNAPFPFCDSQVAGRLPYSFCLFASRLLGTRAVTIPRWNGGRLGNNLLQVVHAIVYAEALGRPEVVLPRDGGHLESLFSMPKKISVVENLDLQHRARCKFDTTSDFFDGSDCIGVKREDYRRALLLYLKPRLNDETLRACAAESTGFSGLTIHLRSGDLLQLDHKQSQFLPCAFHDLVIAAGNYTEVRVVTEPDMTHPCLASLRDRHSDKLVTVQSRSIQEDACALMTAHHLEFGDTTFAQLLEMMNENVKDVSMPSVLSGGAHQWYAAGAADDPMGSLVSCNSNNMGSRRYNLYSVTGVDMKSKGRNRMDFLETTPSSSLQSVQMCGIVAS